MKLTDTIRRERDALAVRFIESGGKLPWLETLRLTALVALGGEFAETVKQAMFVAGARAGVVLEWEQLDFSPSTLVADYEDRYFELARLSTGKYVLHVAQRDMKTKLLGARERYHFDSEFAARGRALEIVHEMSTRRPK